MVSVNPIPKPIRDVHIDYEIDDEKCMNCLDKPCLNVCPINSIYLDSNTKFIKLMKIVLDVSYVQMHVHMMQFTLKRHCLNRFVKMFQTLIKSFAELVGHV